MRLTILALLLWPFFSFGQANNLIEYDFDEPTPNVNIIRLGDDSLSSAFLIVIKTEVKSHKHAQHTENVYFVDGEGMMTLGLDTFAVKSGDHVFIPKNTFHSVKVTSTKPLKVLSVQSPEFDGSDRIWEQR
jgi:mannose-6-phosphate isomerase-like protein (cupin superfamily)